MFGGTARVQAIISELDTAADEYDSAKSYFDDAKARFDFAREKLTTVKSMAEQMLTTADWWAWQNRRPEVRYAALTTGDAILMVLRVHAFAVGGAFWESPETQKYDPYLALDQIAAEMEKGGFEFRSSATGREVNAALINLSGVKKSEDGRYAVADSDQILQWCKTLRDAEVRP